MSTLPQGIRRAFRLALGRPPIEEDVDAEISFHLEMRVADMIARGMSAEDARAEALRRFGDTRHWSTAMSEVDRERVGQQRRAEWLDDLRHDLRYGVRALLRAPLFSLLAVVTLALGIGANAAVFGVVKSVLLNALPYHDADRVLRVYGRLLDGTDDRGPLSAGTIDDLVERQQSFEHTAAFASLPREGVYADDGGARVVKIAWAEPELFRVLGVPAARGRTLRADDAEADTAAAVMLTHDAWQRLFAGDAGALGRSVRVDGISREIVGVLPRGFVGPAGDVDLYFPLNLRPVLSDPVSARGSHWLGMIGRVRAGVSVEAARRELVALAADLAREYPKENGYLSVAAVPVREALAGDTRTPLLVLMASAGLVLLITCANLAGALLARTISRRKEFAVRVALGAGRGRLVRQLLTESTVLALVGGAAGVGLATLGLGVLRGLAAHALPAYAELSLDPGALVFTSLLAVGTGLAFGVAPAIAVGRADPQKTLRDATRGASESRGSRHLRGVLVAGQIALCVSILAGAGLLARSLRAMTSAPLGFTPDGVFSAVAQLPAGTYPTEESRARFIERYLERLRAIPGVTDVASASSVPTQVLSKQGIVLEGSTPATDATPFVLFASVSEDYFRTLGIPLRGGRNLGPADREDAPPVVVISESMARRYWPKGNAVGSRLRMGPDPQSRFITVVGVVGDVRNDRARADAEPIAYTTYRQMPWPNPVFLLRTSGDPLALIKPAERALADIDRGVPLDNATTLGAILADGLAGRRLPAVLMAAFGVLALLLASVGVYAMFADMAVAREREFGVRMALGSSRRDIAGLVLRQGGVWIAAGLAGGALGVVLVARVVGRLLYGVAPFDPLAIGLALVALLASATVALLVPVHRATRVDPITAMR